MSVSTRDSFDLYRAYVIGSVDGHVVVSLPSVAGPETEIKVPYPYLPPKAGSRVWMAVTHSFDKFYIIDDPLSVLSSFVDILRTNAVEWVSVSNLESAISQLRGDS